MSVSGDALVIIVLNYESKAPCLKPLKDTLIDSHNYHFIWNFAAFPVKLLKCVWPYWAIFRLRVKTKIQDFRTLEDPGP